MSDKKENKIKLKTFIGYLKTISFVTEDVLKNKMLYLTASLEKTPRAIPKRMAAESVAPAKPPVAAVPLNAWVKIRVSEFVN